MTEVLATLGPCCGILRRGMEEPSVMHNGLCREKHDGCLGPTIYLVDAAEVERLRAELAECKRDAERLNWLEQNQSGVYPVTERVRVPTTTMMPRYIDEWRFVSWSVSSRFDELPNIRNAIDAALVADGENNDGNA